MHNFPTEQDKYTLKRIPIRESFEIGNFKSPLSVFSVFCKKEKQNFDTVEHSTWKYLARLLRGYLLSNRSVPGDRRRSDNALFTASNGQRSYRRVPLWVFIFIIRKWIAGSECAVIVNSHAREDNVERGCVLIVRCYRWVTMKQRHCHD